MKCRAAEVYESERTEQVTKMYGTKALEAMQSEAALLLLDNFPWFRRAGLKSYFDAQAGNCSRELNDNAADRIFIKDRRGRHEADEIMRFEEVVNDAEFALSRRMDFGGIEVPRVMKEKQKAGQLERAMEMKRMRDEEGLRAKEISARTGIHINTVYMLLKIADGKEVGG